jgi:hypothetical protein
MIVGVRYVEGGIVARSQIRKPSAAMQRVVW